jgi:hypothetical protein
MRKFILMLVVLVAVVTVGCTDDELAKKVLIEQGYQNVILMGYRLGGCAENDNMHTGFVATNSVSNKKVEGVVCSQLSIGTLFGVGKGATVRFF